MPRWTRLPGWLSKPNLLYYFPSKDAIHAELIRGLLKVWLDPLRKMDPAGDPLSEILAYMRRKLELSRDFPRESRLFANEILQRRAACAGPVAGRVEAIGG